MELRNLLSDFETGAVWIKAEAEEEEVEEEKEEVEEEPRRCLICLSVCNSDLEFNLVEGVERLGGYHEEHCETIRKDLFTVFLLRNLLGSSSRRLCEELMIRTKGESPSSWCRVCEECSEAVKNGLGVHFRILRLEADMRNLSKQVDMKMERSFDVDGRTHQGRSTKGGGMARGKKVDTHEIIRHYYFNEKFPKSPRRKGCTRSAQGRTKDNPRWSGISKSPAALEDFEQESTYGFQNFDGIDTPEKLVIGFGGESASGGTIKRQRRSRRLKSVSTTTGKSPGLEEMTNDCDDDRDPLYFPSDEDFIEEPLQKGQKRLLKRNCVKRKVCSSNSSVLLTQETTAENITDNELSEEDSTRKLFGVQKAVQKRNPLICNICNHTFASKLTFSKHKLDHKRFTKVSCKICKYPLESEDKLELHMRRYHTTKNKLYKCSKCDYSSVGYANYWYHKQTNHLHAGNIDDFEEADTIRNRYKRRKKTPIFFCKLCKRGFTNIIIYQRHLRLHRRFETTCRVCNYPCATEVLLVNHMKKYHKIKSPVEYQCEKCPFATDKPDKFYVHQISHEKPEDEKPLRCSKCNHSSGNLRHFNAHLKLHDTCLETTCAQCNYPLSSVQKLEAHIRRHHRVPSVPPVEHHYHCDRCPYKCKDRSIFARHKTKHVIEDNYEHIDNSLNTGQVKCKQCQEVVITRKMQRHLREVHSFRGGLSLCHYCHKTFAARTGLREHIRNMHEATKKFTCETCGKEFMMKRRWESHISKCTQEIKSPHV